MGLFVSFSVGGGYRRTIGTPQRAFGERPAFGGTASTHADTHMSGVRSFFRRDLVHFGLSQQNFRDLLLQPFPCLMTSPLWSLLLFCMGGPRTTNSGELEKVADDVARALIDVQFSSLWRRRRQSQSHTEAQSAEKEREPRSNLYNSEKRRRERERMCLQTAGGGVMLTKSHKFKTLPPFFCFSPFLRRPRPGGLSLPHLLRTVLAL